MKIYRKEVAQRVCHQCQKLHWHFRHSLDVRFRVHLIVLTLITFGLAWLIYYFLHCSYGVWTCKYCGHKKRKSETANLPLSSGSERCADDYPVKADVPVQFEPQEIHRTPLTRKSSPKTQFPRPTRRGSYSDSKAFLHRPKYGSSNKEYWDWHDTLYLGGSHGSLEWKARAREAKAIDNYQCVICGATENLETDHIIELSRGGSNEFDNLQTLCKICHDKKTEENRRKANGR